MSSEANHSPATGIRTSPWSHVAARITNWHNWKLAAKLAAVILVPVICACALGVLHIRNQVREADDYAYLGNVVSAAESVRGSITLLQEERTLSAEFLAGGQGTPATVQERFTATDAAWKHSADLLRSRPSSDAVVGLAHDEVERKIAEIHTLRQQVLGGHIDPINAINSYTDIIRSVLALDRALIGLIPSSRLAPTATSLHELTKINHEIKLQEDLVLVGLHRGNFPPPHLIRLGESETRRLSAVDEFRAAATPHQRLHYDTLYFQPEIAARASTLRAVLSTTGSAPAPTTVADWKSLSRTELDALHEFEDHMGAYLRNTTRALHESASNTAGFGAVLLLSTLLVAGSIVVIVARQLLGSLTALRRSALDSATRQLPQAVADIRSGSPARTVPRVPVDTDEEIGQVARAFEDVNTQAITLATEQADLRKSYSESFVNVSRRSQSLLERQLRLFEQLERDEQDPDQLATLFRLDHLATRMRRNNENLMVLAGSELTRRFSQPASPANLIRAAVSEIEHYPRVVVQPLPNIKIVGYVANDLVRLFAELLDNAANFSSPHTSVTVTAYRHDDGSFDLDIVDSGIGMDEAELEAANLNLASDREIDLSTSRRMGMFVVGRLATRHNIRVELHHGPNKIGVRATVTLPPELLVDVASTHHPSTTSLDEDALVSAYDWEVAEQDAAPPNGAHTGADSEPTTPVRQSLLTANESAEPAHPRTNGHAPTANTATRNTVPVHRNSVTAPSPIFDNLASAWFQAPTGSVPEQPSGGQHRADPSTPPTGGGRKGTSLSDVEERFPSSQDSVASEQVEDWSTPSDEARCHAETVSMAEADTFTSAGLPLRKPRAHLIAGSAENDDASCSSGQAQRNPDASRTKLASFQKGLREGRRRAIPDENEGNPTAPHSAPPNGTNGTSTEWTLGSDRMTQHVEDTLQHQPSGYTSAGLPQRTPRAQLVPGAVEESATEEGPTARNADLVRGRLERFQQGVREGKHALREQR